MKKLLLTLLLVSSLAQAEELSIGYGAGILADGNHYIGEVKHLTISYRSTLWDGIYTQYKIGYFGDGSPEPDRNSSFWGSVGLGLEVDLLPVEIRSGWGLAAISNPDSRLGGMFPQLHGDLYLGLRDKRGNGIGVQYCHLSSGGLVSPNYGRDFLLLVLSQKW